MRFKPETISSLDEKIPYTLFKIFADFYNYNENNVCVYICESSDGKQFVRERKFIQWFRYFNDGGYIQITESLKNEYGIEYPIGMILKLRNSFKADIINAFEKFITGHTK